MRKTWRIGASYTPSSCLLSAESFSDWLPSDADYPVICFDKGHPERNWRFSIASAKIASNWRSQQANAENAQYQQTCIPL
jgi:hypothetical protein